MGRRRNFSLPMATYLHAQRLRVHRRSGKRGTLLPEYATEQSYCACARDRSWQNANPAQQAEPVRLPKRTQ